MGELIGAPNKASITALNSPSQVSLTLCSGLAYLALVTPLS